MARAEVTIYMTEEELRSDYVDYLRNQVCITDYIGENEEFIYRLGLNGCSKLDVRRR